MSQGLLEVLRRGDVATRVALPVGRRMVADGSPLRSDWKDVAVRMRVRGSPGPGLR